MVEWDLARQNHWRKYVFFCLPIAYIPQERHLLLELPEVLHPRPRAYTHTHTPQAFEMTTPKPMPDITCESPSNVLLTSGKPLRLHYFRPHGRRAQEARAERSAVGFWVDGRQNVWVDAIFVVIFVFFLMNF